MAETVFVVNPVGFEKEFRSWDGDIGRHLQVLTNQLAIRARISAPGPGKPPRNRTKINYATGVLEASIITGRGRWMTELEGQVIALPKHALFVHEGTDPHVIVPKKPGGLLRFTRHGKVIFAKKVNHPGTMAVPFLSENLPLVIK